MSALKPLRRAADKPVAIREQLAMDEIERVWAELDELAELHAASGRNATVQRRRRHIMRFRGTGFWLQAPTEAVDAAESLLLTWYTGMALALGQLMPPKLDEPQERTAVRRAIRQALAAVDAFGVEYLACRQRGDRVGALESAWAGLRTAYAWEPDTRLLGYVLHAAGEALGKGLLGKERSVANAAFEAWLKEQGQ